MSDSCEIAIFPLHTVLFPGATLPLRIFEQRYLTMISECLKNKQEFGVCLIKGSGKEVGERIDYYHCGSSAEIIDFEQSDSGALNITVRANKKFNILEAEYQQDNLLKARVSFVEEESLEFPEKYAGLREVFKTIGGSDTLCENLDTVEFSYHLSSLAPVSNSKKQTLLECTSAIERLGDLETIFSKIHYTMTA